MNKLLIIVLSLTLVALTYSFAYVVRSANVTEQRSFIIERNDRGVRLLGDDGSELTDGEVEWANNASATNIGTSIDIMHNEEATVLTVVQGYNAFGWRTREGSSTILR